MCVNGTCFPGGDDDDDDSAGSDPNYPNPADGCPAGTVNGNMALMPGINACLPMCDGAAADIMAACPQPASGMSPGLCVVGDGSGSGDACEMNGAACEGESEFCLGNPMTMMNECTAAIICVISCQGGGACPDGMTCNSGACGY